MGLLSWILLGLIVGALAKWIMPGDDPGGFVLTTLLGVAGAFLGGWLGSLVGIGTFTGFNLGSLALAVVGAILILGAYRRLWGRGSS